MMGYRENFLSYLLSKVDADTPLASFLNRGFFPFSAGTVYDKQFFKETNADWLPLIQNPYADRKFRKLYDFEKAFSSWVDSGEQFAYEALLKGKNVYFCFSRGVTGDFFADQFERTGMTFEEFSKLGYNIKRGEPSAPLEEFAKKYELLVKDEKVVCWAKSFNDDGGLIFLHKGRGGGKDPRRGDMLTFLKRHNESLP